MARKLVDVLEEQGMSLNLQAGGEAPKEMVDREVKEGATERAAKLKDIYLQTLSSVTCEFPIGITVYFRLMRVTLWKCAAAEH